jgi:hypothetical protein
MLLCYHRLLLLPIFLLAFAPVLAWSQGIYTTNFSLIENAIFDGGRWINGKSGGLAWQNVRTTSGLAYGTQSGSSGLYDDSTAVLTGTWGQNQTAQATVHSINQNPNVWEEVELRLRTTITANKCTGYEINFRCLKTGGAYMEIVRWNGALGSFTRLAHYDGAQYGVADGDAVKATIVGSTITAYINGTQMGQATDGSVFTSGSPGLGFWLQGNANTSDYGFTSFSASDGSTVSATQSGTPPDAPRNLRNVH